jgi:hypothetical protein
MAVADRAQGSLEQRHKRIERRRDMLKSQDQGNENRPGDDADLKKLQADVVWRQSAGRDPGTNHSSDEECCADELGE